GDAAHDQVHAVGQAETVAARLDQLASLDEVAQQPLERAALLMRDPQTLHQVASRGGMLDLVPNELEQLLVVQHCFDHIFCTDACRGPWLVVRGSWSPVPGPWSVGDGDEGLGTQGPRTTDY